MGPAGAAAAGAVSGKKNLLNIKSGFKHEIKEHLIHNNGTIQISV
jgi:hypothetical protein